MEELVRAKLRAMTSLDPRTPVLIGAAQLNDRSGENEPVEFMVRAAQGALADCGQDIRSRIESVRVIKGIWRYADPGSLVAERLGLGEVHTGLTRIGGNGVYDLVSETAAEIQNGQLGAALICSAEVLRTVRAKKAAGLELVRIPEGSDAASSTTYGKDRPITSPEEDAAGLTTAVNFYAAAETALRHRLGEESDVHLSRIAQLWAGASSVAANNPAAWIQSAQDSESLSAVGAKNRMVASPYPKMLTANINVDQAAAVIMCAAEVAEAAGISRDRWVFPLSGSGAADHWTLFDRYLFDASPAMRLSGQTALGLAGLSIDEVDMLDIYSCFPVAVQVAQHELGIDPDRPFTITGGLTFAGGPLNSYCLHGLARSVELLRESTGATAFLTGNGGFFTKHSALVVGSDPGLAPFRSESPQASVDALPARPRPTRATEGRIEAYTVTHGRDGPDRAIVTVLDSRGARHLTNSNDEALMESLLAQDLCETPVQIDHSTEVPTVHV